MKCYSAVGLPRDVTAPLLPANMSHYFHIAKSRMKVLIGLEKFICFWLLRIFGLTATYTVAPRQCKLNKFICIALGFCVYLQPELKERCRSGRTGQSRKLLNSLWVPGVRIPLSPQNPEGKKGSKYDESRKIKVLRDFLFIFSDTRKTRKSPVWTEYRY